MLCRKCSQSLGFCETWILILLRQSHIIREVQIDIRDIRTFSEYQACAQLQLEVWGFPELDVVPAGQLVAIHRYGGTCIGAFDGDRVVGFVFGFPGFTHGRIFHHSHMLAVKPEYRGQRLGEHLKWAQCDGLLAQSVLLVNWTFDPLQALNANLNINRLGVVSQKYILNLYGESQSPLHGGIPTDRLEADWHLDSERVNNIRASRLDDFPLWEDLPRANRSLVRDSGLLACAPGLELELEDAAVLVEVPKEYTDLMATDRGLALDWRYQTRQIFQAYFKRGYQVQGLHRSRHSAYYRLEKKIPR